MGTLRNGGKTTECAYKSVRVPNLLSHSKRFLTLTREAKTKEKNKTSAIGINLLFRNKRKTEKTWLRDRKRKEVIYIESRN